MKTSENLGFPDVFRLYEKDKWHEMSKYLQNRLDIFLEILIFSLKLLKYYCLAMLACFYNRIFLKNSRFGLILLDPSVVSN